MFRYDINWLYHMCSFRGGFSFFSIEKWVNVLAKPKHSPSEFGPEPNS